MLQSRLAPFILGNPDQQNDVQTKAIRVLKVPEYFGEYRETGDGYAAFLGASIVAKVRMSCSGRRGELTIVADIIQRPAEQKLPLKGGLLCQRPTCSPRDVSIAALMYILAKHNDFCSGAPELAHK